MITWHLTKPQPPGDQEVNNAHEEEGEDELADDEEKSVSFQGRVLPTHLAALRHYLSSWSHYDECLAVDCGWNNDYGGDYPDEDEDGHRGVMGHSRSKRVHYRQISAEETEKMNL